MTSYNGHLEYYKENPNKLEKRKLKKIEDKSSRKE